MRNTMTFREYEARRKISYKRPLFAMVKDFMGNLFGTVKENDLFVLYHGRLELLRDLKAQLKGSVSKSAVS